MAKPSLHLTIVFLITFSLFFLSSALPSETITNAIDTLSNSGYIAMALTLQLTAATILAPHRRSATIFSPPDAAFSDSGQPSLSLLRLHFAPVALSVESLQSLPYGTKIPTLSSGHSLAVTSYSSDDQISLNTVRITGSPIYDDGSVVVFGIETFFNPNFTLPFQIQSPSSDSACNISLDAYSFREASTTLRSKGYAITASFLELQLIGFIGQPKLTVFAPVDEVMVEEAGDITEYSSLFLRHVVPCRLSWTDIADLNNGTEIQTYLEGFKMNLTRANDVFMVNEVAVTFPDMYYSDWLVVHGVPDILSVPKTSEQGGEEEPSVDVSEGNDQELSIAPDHAQF